MEHTRILHNTQYRGNKGLDLAMPARLTLRLLQYESLTASATTPPALRDYSVAVVTEIRELLRRPAVIARVVP